MINYFLFRLIRDISWLKKGFVLWLMFFFVVNSSVFAQEQDEFTQEEIEQLESLIQEYDLEETVGAVTLNEDITLQQENEDFLNTLRQNPVDLNTVTYTQLKSLPGITPSLAREIIKHRRRTPFSAKKDLLSVRGMSNEIYQKLIPYITVKRKKEPFKIKGQTRIRTKMSKPDSEEYSKLISTSIFKNPVYLYNRTQISLGTMMDAGYVFLHRSQEPEINFENIQKYFLRKYWVKLYNLPLTDKLIIGNYKPGFGYGLVFYENASETMRPIKPKPRGLREDKSTSVNSYLYGAGVETSIGIFDTAVFFSKKYLDGTVTTDGTVNEDVLTIKENYGEYTSNTLLKEHHSFSEQLVGVNVAAQISQGKLGFTGYTSEYDKPLDPNKTGRGYNLKDKYSEYWSHVFRGNKLNVGSIYFDLPMSGINFYGEYAKSVAEWDKGEQGKNGDEGNGLNLGLVLPFKKLNFYFLYTNLEPNFYSPHAIPFRIYDSYNNQSGIKYGLEYNFKKLDLKLNYTTGFIPKTLWSGYSGSESPRYPSKYNELWFETKYKLKNIELYCRLWDDLRERYINYKSYGLSTTDFYNQIDQSRIRRRYQVAYEFSKDLTLRLRYENRWQIFLPPQKDSLSYYGEQFYTELKYKFSGVTLNTRFCLFDTGKDVYLSYLEPQWYNLYMSDTENSSSGGKFYFTVSTKLSRKTIAWFRYRYKSYTLKSGERVSELTDFSKILNSVDHDFRCQLDFNF